MVKGDVLNLVQVLQIGLVPPQKIIPFIETHLEVLRDDESLLGTYVSLCSYYKDLERCIRFLEKGLPRRPVLVDWHRLYQQAREAIGETPKMVPQYDDFLQKEPDNSALLYLRGRLEETMKGAFYYYDKAIAADPKNPFPYFAKSFHLACKGELAAARELCGRACSLYPGTHSMKDRLYHLRFAVGEFDALEKKITLQMTKEPSNWDYFQKLVEVRVAQKNIAGAKKALNQYIETLKKQFPENSAEWAAKSQLELDYLLGDFNAMEKHLASLEDETDRNSYLITVYLNRADMEKIDAMPDIKENTNGYTALLYWLGWLDKGDSQKASQWFNRAREYFLASIDNSEKKVGQWLEKSNREIFNRLDGLFLSPEDKRVLYTAFARLYPGERGKMLARAQKMNYLPRSPYHFLAKAIKKMKRM